MKTRPRVWADIDLEAVSHNLGIIRESLGGSDSIMLVVKADAYGHGALPVTRHVLARGEARAFGVGDSQEALELREAGVDAPLLVLGAIVDGEMREVIRHDVALCVHSTDRVRRLEAEARRQERRCRVHVMVDTGMGRLGPFAEKAIEVAEAVERSPHLDLEGIATHFSSTSHKDDPFTREQIERFRAFRESLKPRGARRPIFHAANSGAILDAGAAGFDMARVGAAAYGILSRQDGAAARLRPALSLKTQVIYLKDVPSDTPISYERMHVTRRKTRIATLPIGYNDGFRYGLSNKWHVLVKGRRAPIVGAVSMDYCMVDVGEIPGVRPGDTVTIIGTDGDESISVPQMAAALGTVPYEVTCGLGKRVRRIHRPQPARPVLSDALRVGAREGVTTDP